jgi:polyhydroxyalkanoate synthase
MATPVDPVRAYAGRVRRLLRNAAGRVGGTDPVVGQSPRTAVWSEGRTTLWRYDTDRATVGPPLLVCHSLVSRAFILDLQPGNSVMEHLVAGGFAPYLLEFGVPDARDAGNTLATYADRLVPAAVAAVLTDSGARDVFAMGYSFGGNLLQFALADPNGSLPVRAFVALGVPIDYQRMGFLTGPLLGLEPELLLDDTGNLPVQPILRAFRTLQPTNELAANVNLLAHLDDDRWLAGYDAMTKWIDEQVPFPGAAFVEAVRELIRGNGLVGDGPVVGGTRRPLSAITCPVLVVAAVRDAIVPPEATLPQVERYGGPVELLEPDAGHVGLVAGREAARKTLPVLMDWLRTHAD